MRMCAEQQQRVGTMRGKTLTNVRSSGRAHGRKGAHADLRGNRSSTCANRDGGQQAAVDLLVGNLKEALGQHTQRQEELRAPERQAEARGAVAHRVAAHRRRRLVRPHAPAGRGVVPSGDKSTVSHFQPPSHSLGINNKYVPCLNKAAKKEGCCCCADSKEDLCPLGH